MKYFQKTDEFKVLVEAYRSGTLAVFLGAGCSQGANLPSGEELFSAIREHFKYPLGEENSPVYNENYHMSQLVADENGIGFVQNIAADLIEEKLNNATTQPVHKALARARKIHMFFTANYDDLLEKEFRHSKRRFQGPVFLDEEVEKVSRDSGTAKIFKLHGDLSKRSSLILTYRQIMEFQFEHPALSRELENVLTNYTCLFIGTTLKDRDIELIYNQALRNKYTPDRKCYIIRQLERDESDQSKRIRPDEKFYSNILKVFPIYLQDYNDVPAFIETIVEEADALDREEFGSESPYISLLDVQDIIEDKFKDEIERIQKKAGSGQLKQAIEGLFHLIDDIKKTGVGSAPRAVFHSYLRLAEYLALNHLKHPEEDTKEDPLEILFSAEEILSSLQKKEDEEDDPADRLKITTAIVKSYKGLDNSDLLEEAISLLREIDTPASQRVLLQIYQNHGRFDNFKHLLQKEPIESELENIEKNLNWLVYIIPGLINVGRTKEARIIAEKAFEKELAREKDGRNPDSLMHITFAFQQIAYRKVEEFRKKYNMLKTFDWALHCLDLLDPDMAKRTLEATIILAESQLFVGDKENAERHLVNALSIANGLLHSLKFKDDFKFEIKDVKSRLEKIISGLGKGGKLDVFKETIETDNIDRRLEWIRTNLTSDSTVALASIMNFVTRDILDPNQKKQLRSILEDFLKNRGTELSFEETLISTLNLIDLHISSGEYDAAELALNDFQCPVDYIHYQQSIYAFYLGEKNNFSRAVSTLENALKKDKDRAHPLVLHVLIELLWKQIAHLSQTGGDHKTIQACLKKAGGYSAQLQNILLAEEAYINEPFMKDLLLTYHLNRPEEYLQKVMDYEDKYGINIDPVHRYLHTASVRLSAMMDFKGPLKDYSDFISKTPPKGSIKQKFKGNENHLAQYLSLLTRNGNIDDAIKIGEEALSEYPDSPDVKVQLALTYQQNEQFQKAWQTIKSAMKQFPQNQTVYEVAFFIGIQTGRDKEVKALYEKFGYSSGFSDSDAIRTFRFPDDMSKIKNMIEDKKKASEELLNEYRAQKFPGYFAAQMLGVSFFAFHNDIRWRGGLSAVSWINSDSHFNEVVDEFDSPPESIVLDYSALLTLMTLDEEAYLDIIEGFNNVYITDSFINFIDADIDKMRSDLDLRKKFVNYKKRMRDALAHSSMKIELIESQEGETPFQTLYRFADDNNLFILEEYQGEHGSFKDGRKRVGIRAVTQLLYEREIKPRITSNKLKEIETHSEDFIPSEQELRELGGRRIIAADCLTLNSIIQFGLFDTMLAFFDKIYIPQVDYYFHIEEDIKSYDHAGEIIERLKNYKERVEYNLEHGSNESVYKRTIADEQIMDKLGFTKFSEKSRERYINSGKEHHFPHELLISKYQMELYAASYQEKAPILSDEAFIVGMQYQSLLEMGYSYKSLNTYELLYLLKGKYFSENDAIGANQYTDYQLILADLSYRFIPYDIELLDSAYERSTTSSEPDARYVRNETKTVDLILNQYREKLSYAIAYGMEARQKQQNMDEVTNKIIPSIILPYRNLLIEMISRAIKGEDKIKEKAKAKYFFNEIFIKAEEFLPGSDTENRLWPFISILITKVNFKSAPGEYFDVLSMLRSLMEETGYSPEIFDSTCEKAFCVAIDYEYDYTPLSDSPFSSIEEEKQTAKVILLKVLWDNLPYETQAYLRLNEKLMERLGEYVELEEDNRIVIKDNSTGDKIAEFFQSDLLRALSKAIHSFSKSGKRRHDTELFNIDVQSDSQPDSFLIRTFYVPKRVLMMKEIDISPQKHITEVIRLFTSSDMIQREIAWKRGREKIEKIYEKRLDIKDELIRRWDQDLKPRLLSSDKKTWSRAGSDCTRFLISLKFVFDDIITDYIGENTSPHTLLIVMSLFSSPATIVNWIKQKINPNKTPYYTLQQKANLHSISEIKKVKADAADEIKKLSEHEIREYKDKIFVTTSMPEIADVPDIVSTFRPFFYSPYKVSAELFDTLDHVIEELIHISAGRRKQEERSGDPYYHWYKNILRTETSPVFWLHILASFLRLYSTKSEKELFKNYDEEHTIRTIKFFENIFRQMFGTEPFDQSYMELYEKDFKRISTSFHNRITLLLAERWIFDYCREVEPEDNMIDMIFEIAAVAGGWIDNCIESSIVTHPEVKDKDQLRDFLTHHVSESLDSHHISTSNEMFLIYKDRKYQIKYPIFPISRHAMPILASFILSEFAETAGNLFYSDMLRKNILDVATNMKYSGVLIGFDFNRSALDFGNEEKQMYFSVLNFLKKGAGTSFSFWSKSDKEKIEELESRQELNAVVNEILQYINSVDLENYPVNLLGQIFHSFTMKNEEWAKMVISLLKCENTDAFLNSQKTEGIINAIYFQLAKLFTLHHESPLYLDLKELLIDVDYRSYSEKRFQRWVDATISISYMDDNAKAKVIEAHKSFLTTDRKRAEMIRRTIRRYYEMSAVIPDDLVKMMNAQ